MSKGLCSLEDAVVGRGEDGGDLFVFGDVINMTLILVSVTSVVRPHQVLSQLPRLLQSKRTEGWIIIAQRRGPIGRIVLSI